MYYPKAKGLIFLILILISFITFAKPCIEKSYNQKGLKYLNKKNYSLAEANFKKALQCNPKKPFIYNNLAVALINLKRYNEAENYLKKALKLKPHYLKALSNLASIYYYKGQYKKAYEVYKKVNRLDSYFIKRRFPQNKVLSKMKARSKKRPHDYILKKIINYLQ